MGVPYGRPGPGNRAAVLGLPFDCGVHPSKCGGDLRRELRQRILSAQFDEVNAFTHVGDEREMIAPRPIDREQHHVPLRLADGRFARRADQRLTFL